MRGLVARRPLRATHAQSRPGAGPCPAAACKVNYGRGIYICIASYTCNVVRVNASQILVNVHVHVSLLYTCSPSMSQCQLYTCQVSGPLSTAQSATVNHPTHVLVELRDSNGALCSLQQHITARLEPEAPTRAAGKWPWSKNKKPPETHVEVTVTSPSQYKVSYTPVSRGRHKLHVQVNGRELKGSPFTITVYPDPTQLGHPVRVMTGISQPQAIAFNSRGEMIVSETECHSFGP